MFHLREEIEDCASAVECARLQADLDEQEGAAAAALQTAWEVEDRDGLTTAAVTMKYVCKGLEELERRREQLE